MLYKSHRDQSVIATLRERLRRVFWMGGASGAGKSTIARRIASQHGFHLYDTDGAMADHANRFKPEDCPFLNRFIAMDMDERWVNRSPASMLDTFHWFQGEGFGLVIEDLLNLSPDRPVIAEGFRLLPDLVSPLLSIPSQAVWLLPTPAFRKAAFESRGGTGLGFLAKTSDPDKALRNLLKRDEMFTERLRRQTGELNLSAITVDLATSEIALFNQISQLLAFETGSSNCRDPGGSRDQID